MENYTVVKKAGHSEVFSFAKLRKSLSRSGASDRDVAKVMEQMQTILYDGMTSKEIYQKAFALLKKENRIYACKYSLKQALFDLGPTGYPFERLISALLQKRGYSTMVSVILEGECVSHEVDVLAKKEGNSYPIECKFHSKAHYVNNVKTPLYIQSRYLDIEKRWSKNPKRTSELKQGWIITNTKFSSDAIAYATCVNLRLLSWDYPVGKGLNFHIDSYGLYPVTALTTISKKEKDMLMEKDIILITELQERGEALDQVGISPVRIKKIIREVNGLIAFDINKC